MVSSLQPGEYIELMSTLYGVEDTEFQCTKCLRKYEGRSDEEQITKISRESKGCFGISPNALHKRGHFKYYTCIGNFYSESALFWIEAEARYNQGVMPFPGSMVEQPAKVLEVFSCIAAHKQDKLEKQKQAQRMIQRGQRNGRRNQNQINRRR